MAQHQTEQHRDPMVLAIERVLEAERSAEAGLRDCRHRKEVLISAAREQAATISRRADARISRLHTAYLNKISTEVARLSAPALTGNTVGADDAELAGAARRLAARLAGAP